MTKALDVAAFVLQRFSKQAPFSGAPASLLRQGVKNSEMPLVGCAEYKTGSGTAVLAGTEDLFGALEEGLDGFITGGFFPLTMLCKLNAPPADACHRTTNVHTTSLVRVCEASKLCCAGSGNLITALFTVVNSADSSLLLCSVVVAA